MKKTAYFIKIKGRVTGVAFRYSALQKSRDFPSITGYIRNAGYAEVETLVQGEEEEVNQMLIWLRQGPSLARIDEFFVSECPYDDNLTEYKVTY